MTHDPLLPFLERELEAMPGLLAQVVMPMRPLKQDDDVLRTVEFGYRYTWQEVERARRYMKPLDALPRDQAKRSAIAQINNHCFETILSDERIRRMGPEVTAEALDARLADEQEIDVEQSHMVELPNGLAIHWVANADVIALPTSVVRRHISWREEMSAYQIKESVDLGDLEILRPDLLMTRAAAPDPEPGREPKRF